MKVAFDYDDVLVDFVGCWVRSVNELMGKDLKREDLRLDGWDMATHASEIVGMNWLDEWLKEHIEYWYEAETTPGALATLKRLHEKGHSIEIVTNKPNWAKPVVWNWCQTHNPAVDKVTIANHFAKHEISDADILIDDRPSTLHAWNNSRPGRLGVLFARSQNKAQRHLFPVAETFDDIEWIVEYEEARRG